MNGNSAITKFRGKFDFLSNFYPVFVVLDGVRYPSVEHAFQAAKTLDPDKRKLFRICAAKDAKKLGKRLDLRDDWEDVKLDLMYDLISQKFTNSELRNRLLATGDCELVEFNTWGDRFWGVDKSGGSNNLGKILMKVRDDAKVN